MKPKQLIRYLKSPEKPAEAGVYVYTPTSVGKTAPRTLPNAFENFISQFYSNYTYDATGAALVPPPSNWRQGKSQESYTDSTDSMDFYKKKNPCFPC